MHASPHMTAALRREATRREAGSAGIPGQTQGAEPEVDLDRLVWDPEYRKAMLPVLKRGR